MSDPQPTEADTEIKAAEVEALPPTRGSSRSQRPEKSSWKVKLKVFLSLCLIGILTAFVIFNFQSITLDLLVQEIQLPAGILYMLILLIGFVFGFLFRQISGKKRRR